MPKPTEGEKRAPEQSKDTDGPESPELKRVRSPTGDYLNWGNAELFSVSRRSETAGSPSVN